MTCCWKNCSRALEIPLRSSPDSFSISLDLPSLKINPYSKINQVLQLNSLFGGAVVHFDQHILIVDQDGFYPRGNVSVDFHIDGGVKIDHHISQLFIVGK